MSAEDLEKYETEMELSLYREYKDIVGQFSSTWPIPSSCARRTPTARCTSRCA
ncbi:Protein of uncharacterised function (DUF2469) [Mycobacteroides abscessus subsp. abscessus]|nr:Protein of uncharacterised function (DUF2469) [Mycobacteroides abscessus subsp. abscessus]